MHFHVLLKLDMEVANTRSSLTSKWLNINTKQNIEVWLVHLQ